MSVIQRIRDRAAWIVFGAIALSLLAFILQDAFSGNRGGGGLFSNTTTVGKVNGASIEKDEFENKLTFYQQANGMQRDQLIGSVWDYLVDQTIMQQEYDKLGLAYTSKQQSDEWFSDNPPQMLQQIFGDRTTGMYNPEQARQFFSQLKKNPNDPRAAQIAPYLDQIIQDALRQKYQALVTGAVYVPKWLAEKTNTDNNSLAKISFVSVPYNTISDSLIKVTDDDINAYVKKHSKKFQQKEETRQISYVSFDASPSAADTQAVKDQLNQLKPEFASTADEKSFLSKNNSEMPYYSSYKSKNELKQEANDSILALAPGQVYGPYLNENNFVLAKVVDKKDLPDSVKVRHVLVATHQQDPQTGQSYRVKDDSAAVKRLDSAIAELNSGKSWDSVCVKYSDDPGSKDKGGVYDYFPSGRMVEEFNDFVFTGKPGEKKTVQTSYGYHYIEIMGQKGSTPSYKIAYLAKPITASQETDDAARSAADQFASNNRDDKKFAAAATKLNKGPLTATDIKENDFSIPVIGENRQLVRWIYDNSVGDVSEPFQVSDKYVVAMITGIAKQGLMPAHAARQSVEPVVRNEKKAQQIISTKIKGNTLDAIAKSAGATVQVADSISFQAFVIPNVGNEPKVIGAAFNKQMQGKVSSPIAGNTGVFVVSGSGVFATSNLGSNPTMLRESLETQMKSQIGNASLRSLHDAAEVKDYRFKFY